MSKYKFASIDELMKYLPEAEKAKVSAVARSERGFVKAYIEAQNPETLKQMTVPNKTHNWYEERERYLKRTNAAYLKNPTYRRWLSMAVWAFVAPKLHEWNNIFAFLDSIKLNLETPTDAHT